MSDLATTIAVADAAFPVEINGISLYTRAGLLKSRFTVPEQVQLLGCSMHQLGVCPRIKAVFCLILGLSPSFG